MWWEQQLVKARVFTPLLFCPGASLPKTQKGVILTKFYTELLISIILSIILMLTSISNSFSQYSCKLESFDRLHLSYSLPHPVM